MPEGDTIFRTATTLRLAMEGGLIEDARIRDRQFECERIIGAVVAKVEPRGKHLLMHLQSEVGPAAGQANLIIHSHMGMTGSWHVYRPGEPWRKPNHYAALVLSIKQLEVICFSPRLLELLTADQLRRHPHIQQLGPDVLDSDFDMAAALAQFRAHNRLPLGEAVLNQRIVCGIGNIYKSELLFLMGFDPLAPVERYADEELKRMLKKAQSVVSGYKSNSFNWLGLACSANG